MNEGRVCILLDQVTTTHKSPQDLLKSWSVNDLRKPLIFAIALMFSVYSILAVRALGFPRDVVPPRSEFCCDMNGDGQVDVNDAIFVAECFGSSVGMAKWNPGADVVRDGAIDISDIFLVANSFTV
jgi:hypothetical protein